ncbi:hypothetical protein [Paraburkholderia silvatlantica]|uniref:Uncharacterized protein n=1 Tax=Paraburkholderia silvatlantica TaxID=321895 RepID=A0A2U1A8B5_9BURK|nr:hypothetical protein [Paraburkholderia silvatlantica]MBB2929032.1 hypothetical protein [Paraburkholderia silvatlantica]PVY29127.1 hypothetical protein C7411_11546 [Paraburkholderia silvatlantica]PXW36602.1 hypothetical protein C7413_11446 [Paraburkholderia silvatlantica]PYE22086.1 hypothetical protein C7410_11119 [Paraburkholderia silvatlantica]TDQ98990.1 hypothetical protein C7412_104207 [Paraburkholderia silvatlantica]
MTRAGALRDGLYYHLSGAALAKDNWRPNPASRRQAPHRHICTSHAVLVPIAVHPAFYAVHIAARLTPAVHSPSCAFTLFLV